MHSYLKRQTTGFVIVQVVLILVVMEDALVQHFDKLKELAVKVLILVVMEDALVRI